jgi:hypothetical protein
LNPFGHVDLRVAELGAVYFDDPSGNRLEVYVRPG